MPYSAYDAGRRPRAVRPRQSNQADQRRSKRFDYPEPLLLPPRVEVPVDSGPVSPMTQPAPEPAVEAGGSRQEAIAPQKDSIAISPRTSDAAGARSESSSVYSRPASPREDARLRQPVDSKMDADQTQDPSASTAEWDRLEGRRLSDFHVFGLGEAQPSSFGVTTPLVTKLGDVEVEEPQEPPKKARRKHSLNFWSSKTVESELQISPCERDGNGRKIPQRKQSLKFWQSQTPEPTEPKISWPILQDEDAADIPPTEPAKPNRFRFDSLRSSLGDISMSIGQVIGRKRSRHDREDADRGAEEEVRARKVPRTAPQVSAFFAEAVRPLEIDLLAIQAATPDPQPFVPQPPLREVLAGPPSGVFMRARGGGLGLSSSQPRARDPSEAEVRRLVRIAGQRRSRPRAEERPRAVHEHRWSLAERREYGAYLRWAAMDLD